MTTTQVDATTIQLYLLSAQETMSTATFERIVREARLDLPAIVAVTAPGRMFLDMGQVEAMYRTINQTASESIIRLLNHNTGTKMVERARTLLPTLFVMAEKYAVLPVEERVTHTLNDLTAVFERLGTPIAGKAITPKEWRIVRIGCMTCTGAQTTKPICAAWNSVLLKLMQQNAKAPLTIEEVECKATGQAECAYKLRLM